MTKTKSKAIEIILIIAMIVSCFAWTTETANAATEWYWPFDGYTSQAAAYKKISSSYGYRGKGFNRIHYGVDIAEPKGKNVYAVRSGKVITVHNSTSGSAGRYIVIDHLDGYYSTYMHLSAVRVSAGASVTQNTVIGAVGGSANGSESAYGAHLHLRISYGAANNNASINPCPPGYTRVGASFNDGVGYPMGKATISYKISRSTTPRAKPTVKASVSGTTVHLSWNDVSTLHNYMYIRNLDTNAIPFSQNMGKTLSKDVKLSPGRYRATVSAYYAADENSYTYGYVDFTIPTNVTREKPTVKASVSGTTVHLSWNDVSTLHNYMYIRNLDTNAIPFSQNMGKTLSKDVKLSPGRYRATVSAYYAADENSYTYGYVDFTIPTTVTKAKPTVKATVSGTTVHLSWNDVSVIHNYMYIRNLDTNVIPFSQNMGKTLSRDVNLEPGRYRATVSAYYGADENSYTYGYVDFTISDEKYDNDKSQKTEKICDIIKNTKITSLKATKTASKVKLKWKKTAEKYGVDGYIILRATSKNGTYKEIGRTKKLSFTTSKIPPKGKKYYYKVKGYRNVCGTMVYTKTKTVAVKR